MDSLVGYGSDEDNDSERNGTQAWGAAGGGRRRDDDTNYDTVNMDMSEESQEESEPELPPAEPEVETHQSYNNDRRGSDDNRDRDRERDRERDRDRDRDRRSDRRRESPPRGRGDKDRSDRDRRSPRRDDKYNRSERHERSRGIEGSSRDGRRGLLGDRPDDRPADNKVPALMNLKPFGGDAPMGFVRATDTRDAVSPRFTERDRRDREKERDRDRDRHSRRSEERRSSRDQGRSERRSRSRGATSSHGNSTMERRDSPSSTDYRPSSYKVNKKLEVMEKMGLQIKTPDGSMATAQQLRAAAHDPAPAAFNPAALSATRILDQVQKRKLLWSNKNKSEAEEAAKWSGTKFAQDTDGKQVSKFMRLMGIKEPAAVKPEATNSSVDPNKKQEELFQAMQAQYEVARATTHTMRGVGLGFQRGPF